jgi:hypothetical protein
MGKGRGREGEERGRKHRTADKERGGGGMMK